MISDKLLQRAVAQHNETVRRGDHTLKELEYYRGQHQAAMAQLEAAAQESSSLRSKYSDLISDKQRLERELSELRAGGCCTQPDNVALVSEEAETLYIEIKAHHKELVPPDPPSVVVPSPLPSGNEHKPRIPKINIEPFHGAFEQFSSFKSLYDTLIHQSTLSNIEKFSYLISLLRGKALLTVKTIEFNEANYVKAYDKLVAEYTNPRLVATHYLNKILSIKPSGPESPAALRFFLDHYNTDVESACDLQLENLTDFVFLHVALKNMPIETRRL
ncbi:hypothetical protein WDU94_003716 [Cyamophila willieti]